MFEQLADAGLGIYNQAQSGASDTRLMSTQLLSLLEVGDPPPHSIYNPAGTTPLLLVCDHASNQIPTALTELGLDEHVRREHVAWDPGSAIVCEIVADRLNCPAVLANYSRLVIDLNRDPAKDDPSVIPAISDGHRIPGNENLRDSERQLRVEQLHEPYHQAIDRQLSDLTAYQQAPLLLSIHTFTPVLRGYAKPRPWHAGMLWNNDPRLAMPLMAYLESHDHLCIGNNEPYSGQEFAYTLMRHGDARGFPNCAIEIRQDLLKDRNDCLWWAEHLAEALGQVLATPGIHQVEFFDHLDI